MRSWLRNTIGYGIISGLVALPIDLAILSRCNGQDSPNTLEARLSQPVYNDCEVPASIPQEQETRESPEAVREDTPVTDYGRPEIMNPEKTESCPEQQKPENICEKKKYIYYNKLSYLDKYDEKIERTLAYYKNLHGRAPPKNLIKAMIAVESGSLAHRKGAFEYDPMQIANNGDNALDALANQKEHTPLIGNFLFLKGKKKTPRVGDKWDYSQSNMDGDSSICGGIGWLYEKAAKFGVDKETGRVYIKGWRSWEEAVVRYNGGGNPDYVPQVLETQKELVAFDEKGGELVLSYNK